MHKASENTMTKGQHLVSLLRNHQYAEVLKMVETMRTEYGSIIERETNEVLSDEQFFLLLVGELTSTDLDLTEADKQHFFNLQHIVTPYPYFFQSCQTLIYAAIESTQLNKLTNFQTKQKKRASLLNHLTTGKQINAFQEKIADELKEVENDPSIPGTTNDVVSQRNTLAREFNAPPPHNLNDTELFECEKAMSTLVKPRADLLTIISKYQEKLLAQLSKLIKQAYDNNVTITAPDNLKDPYMMATLEHPLIDAGREIIADGTPVRVHSTIELLKANISANTNQLKFLPGDRCPMLNYSENPYRENFKIPNPKISNPEITLSPQEQEKQDKEKERLDKLNRTQTGLVILCLDPKVGKNAVHLLHRLQAIHALEATCREQLVVNEHVKNEIHKTIKILNSHQPTWREKPFIDKLLDVVSLGLRPLSRSFFSQPKADTTAIKDLQAVIKPSRSR